MLCFELLRRTACSVFTTWLMFLPIQMSGGNLSVETDTGRLAMQHAQKGDNISLSRPRMRLVRSVSWNAHQLHNMPNLDAEVQASFIERQQVKDMVLCKVDVFTDGRTFEVWQEGDEANPIVAPAVTRKMTAAKFYDYRSSSGHTGLEKKDQSFVFLFRDVTDPTKLGLFFIHGIQDASQASANVWMTVKGVPEGTGIDTQDDSPAEFDFTTELPGKEDLKSMKEPTGEGTFLAGKWAYAKNTDGAALSMPVDEDWTLEIRFAKEGAVTKWAYYYSTGEHKDLDMSKALFVRNKRQEIVVPTMSMDEIKEMEDPAEQLDVLQKKYCAEGGAAKKEIVRLSPTKTQWCALATSEAGGELTFSFSFGDGSDAKEVKKTAGTLACAEHEFTAACKSCPVTVKVKDTAGCESEEHEIGVACAVPNDNQEMLALEAEAGRQLPSVWIQCLILFTFVSWSLCSS